MSNAATRAKRDYLNEHYTIPQLKDLAGKMNITIRAKWTKGKMITAFIKGGYQIPQQNEDNEDTESEHDEYDDDYNSDHSQDHNHNHNNQEEQPEVQQERENEDEHEDEEKSNLLEDDETPEAQKEDEQKDEQKKDKQKKIPIDSEKLNGQGHNIHLDLSSITITGLITYSRWRHILDICKQELTDEFKKIIVKVLNEKVQFMNLKEELITTSITACKAPTKPPSYKTIPKEDGQAQTNWRQGQQKSLKDKFEYSLSQINGGGLSFWYDVQGRAEGKVRKACIQYYRTFNEQDDKEIVKLQKNINDAVSKMVNYVVGKTIKLKQSNEKKVILYTDLESELQKLVARKKKEGMDTAVFNAMVAELTSKMVLGADGMNNATNNLENDNEEQLVEVEELDEDSALNESSDDDDDDY